MRKWTPRQVYNFSRDEGLSSTIGITLLKNNVSGRELVAMSDSDLQNIAPQSKHLHRRFLLRRIRNGKKTVNHFHNVFAFSILAVLFALAWFLFDILSREESPHFILTIIANDRPDYLSQVLSTLAACSGIEKYTVLFFIEPGNDEVIRLANEFSAAARSVVTINSSRLGCHANKKQALRECFAKGSSMHDFCILVEDDTILAEDALEFFEFARSRYAGDDEIFSVSAYGDTAHRIGETVRSESHYAVTRRRHYTPWVFGLWRDRWNEVHKKWLGWDVQMNFFAPSYSAVDWGRRGEGLRGNRFEIFPILSRSNNIGFERGVHANEIDADKMKQLQFLHHWRGNSGNSEIHSFYELDAKNIVETCREIPFGQDTLQSMC
eukprot:g2365.t1